MADPVNVLMPIWLFWFVIFFIVVLMGVIGWLIWQILKKKFLDTVMFIDKNKRWYMTNVNLKGRSEIAFKQRTYELVENCGLLNSRGKVLYVFAENKPSPMKLDYNTSQWLDSKSLNAIINNKLVQKIVAPQDGMKDMLMLFGAIGGIVAGLSAVAILLIQTGVITPK